MLTLEYCENAAPISDFDVEKVYKEILEIIEKQKNCNWPICTSNIINRVRLGIVLKEIDYTKIQLSIGEKLYPFNEYGQAPGAPEYDLSTKINEKILLIMLGR